MAVNPLSGNSNAKAQATSQPAPADRPAENNKQAAEKKVRQANGTDQRLEAKANVQAQRVSAPVESAKADSSKEAERKEARPRVSDNISSALTNAAIKRQDTPAPESKKSEPKATDTSKDKETRADAAREVPVSKSNDKDGNDDSPKEISKDGATKERVKV